jgi:hypothetical protein
MPNHEERPRGPVPQPLAQACPGLIHEREADCDKFDKLVIR